MGRFNSRVPSCHASARGQRARARILICFPLKKGEVTKVWVKMHNVSLLAYSEDGMSLIATKMGKPIMLDAFTFSMCVESWGRISFARALIEVSSDSDLKKEVIMAIPNEEGIGYIREVIRVEYEWKPPHCVACKRFGHGPTTCPNRVKKDVQKAPSMAANKPNLMADQGEVFVEVKSRRKKGKAGKDMGDASNLRAKDQKEGSTSQSSFGKTSIVEDLNLKNSFEALKDSNNIFEAQGSSKQSSMWTDDLESDDEVDEVIFPEGNKFGD
ncbi:reverse transcriptase domain-containing protein [Tanacetum coccineum]